MGCGSGGSSFNQIDNAIRPGARKVFCVKFQREMEGLDEIPFEGHPLGQKIFDGVSKDAWKMWVEHMKMLMNEYRLNRSEEHTSELQSLRHLVCRLLLEKKKKQIHKQDQKPGGDSRQLGHITVWMR